MTRFVATITAGVLIVLVAGSASSQPAYPTRPIDLLIGYAPGASGDLTERLLAGKA
jgi:tripartite-type tricarboxylate transporter receptor subunit TctC